MQARCNVRTEIPNRTVYVTMSGIFDEEAMRKACQNIREATGSFRGQEHLYLVDMRGMKPAHPSIAALLGQCIGWARQNGVVLCAHLSDDTVQRLQTARIARQATPGDDVTVDVQTLDEAKRVVSEGRERLLSGNSVLTASKVAASGLRAN